jgi:iron complex transport system substrate-binding protein
MEDQLIATTSLCDHPVEAIEKENVGGWSEGTRVEKIRELDPDLLIASDDLQDDIVQKLEKEGFQVLQLKPHSLEEVYESIKEIGRVLGCEEKAGELVSEMKKDISDIDLQGKRVYCEEWMDPPMVSGNWIPGLIQKAGGNYFIEEGKRSREFDLEDLKDFDPEYIFLNVCGAGENVETSDIKERDGWKGITAVEKGNVYTVDDALLNRPGPRLVEGVKKIEKLID